MSTAVARPTGGIVVPERFKNRGVQETLGEGISSGFPIIRLRGSKWRLSMGKDEEHLIPPQQYTDEEGEVHTGNFIDVVILRSPSFASRAYYRGYKQGQKGERPICSSLHGKRPDADVEDKQSPVCDTCKRNQTYTNDKGMKVRDCSNGKRLAVLPWPSWTQPLLGKPLLRPCLLRIPGASLQALKTYGEDLGRAGVPYYGLLTRLSFDEEMEYPKIIFNYNTEVQLDDDSAAIIDEMRETADARFITGENAQSMREVDHEEEKTEAPKEVVHTPKPAAVNLAGLVKAAKTEVKEEAQVPLDGEVLPPQKGPNTLVNGKAAKATKATVKPKVDTKPETVNTEVDTADESDGDLKSEVLALLGKK
jgi:hypothetical protein